MDEDLWRAQLMFLPVRIPLALEWMYFLNITELCICYVNYISIIYTHTHTIVLCTLVYAGQWGGCRGDSDKERMVPVPRLNVSNLNLGQCCDSPSSTSLDGLQLSKESMLEWVSVKNALYTRSPSLNHLMALEPPWDPKALFHSTLFPWPAFPLSGWTLPRVSFIGDWEVVITGMKMIRIRQLKCKFCIFYDWLEEWHEK